MHYIAMHGQTRAYDDEASSNQTTLVVPLARPKQNDYRRATSSRQLYNDKRKIRYEGQEDLLGHQMLREGEGAHVLGEADFFFKTWQGTLKKGMSYFGDWRTSACHVREWCVASVWSTCHRAVKLLLPATLLLSHWRRNTPPPYRHEVVTVRRNLDARRSLCRRCCRLPTRRPRSSLVSELPTRELFTANRTCQCCCYCPDLFDSGNEEKKAESFLPIQGQPKIPPTTVLARSPGGVLELFEWSKSTAYYVPAVVKPC